MRTNRSYTSLLLLAGFLLPGGMVMVSMSGCANIVPPVGGARDSIAPRLVSASPKPAALNVSDKSITLNFNEFVDIANVNENVIISPVQKDLPVISKKLRSVTVRLKDTLEPNTTYSIQFGDAIRDVNEGNILKGFTYVFSTGPSIDTLECAGKIINAENGKPDSTVMVLLHRNGNDSAVAKEKPRYITRPDGSGNFLFSNLPAGNYHIYALKDANGDLRYDQKIELFAFSDSVVKVNADTKPVTLYAYAEETRAAAPAASGTNRNAPKTLQFTTNLQGGVQDLLRDLIITFNKPIKTFNKDKISFTDTLFKPIKDFTITGDSTGKQFTFKYAWKSDQVYKLMVEKEFAEDTTGLKYARTDTFTIRGSAEKEYGKLKIKIRNYDAAKNPVLLFIQNGTVVKTVPVSGAELSFERFWPGEYELRLVLDKNKNGKWDPGAFFNKHLQPEKVIAYDRKWNIKAAWDNEWEIGMEK